MKQLIKKNQRQNLLVLKKLLISHDYTSTHFVNLLILTKLNAIKHLAVKESLINKVWRTTAIIYMLSQKNLQLTKLIISTRVSHQKNKWTTLCGEA